MQTPFSQRFLGQFKWVVAVSSMALVATMLQGAATPSPNSTPAHTSKTAKRNPPFVGIVQKVDIAKGTLTLNGKDGGRVFYVTGESRITKNGQPAKLTDAKVGEEAAGTFRDENGKRYAVTLRLGPKPEPNPAKK